MCGSLNRVVTTAHGPLGGFPQPRPPTVTTGRVAHCVYGVYDVHMSSNELIKRLMQAGWVLRGSKGSHHVFVHPARPGHISVPHPKKDLGIGLVRKLLKAAGLE